jgi:hypothetical protein
MRPHIAFLAVLVLLLTSSSLLAQSSDCTGNETQAQLPSIDPVYVDAMELARNLIDQGFIVKCVLGSQVQNLFEGQKGAAFYRTDQGSFDVVFLPKAESFDAVQVVEQRQGDLYFYSFRGIPHSPGRMEGSKKTYFIKSANLLFLLWSDSDLAGSIQVAVSRFSQAGPSPPNSCPVTKPPWMAFIPPSPYPTELPAGSFWFGNEKLWTSLPMDGTWNGLPHFRPTDIAFRNKLFWWHEGYDWRTENPPNLSVTGKRLDAPASPLATDEHANNGWTNDSQHPFMVSGIFIPTLGCWQITGDYKGDRLTFVVLVEQEQ